jgi:hypothetical protein
MKAYRCFMLITLGLALACIPTGVFGAEDISSLLETKGPGAKGILAKPSIFRESTLPRLPISPGQIEFLIDHPRVLLALAHLYAPFLDNYSVEVRPDQVIHIDDPGKLAGDAELIDARPGRRVYLIAGYFNIFKMRFDGHMVLMTVYSERRENAAVSVDATTTAFIKIDSAVADAFARLADYLFPKKVDERIERFLRAAESIAVAVHKDPAAAHRKLLSAGEVGAEELQEFGRTF